MTHSLTFKVIPLDHTDQSELLRALLRGTDVTPVQRGGEWPIIEFRGTWGELALVVDRYVNETSKNDVNFEQRHALVGLIKEADPTGDVVDLRVKRAVAHVNAYLAEFATLGGMDQEVIHSANHMLLRRSDLELLLSAVNDK